MGDIFDKTTCGSDVIFWQKQAGKSLLFPSPAETETDPATLPSFQHGRMHMYSPVFGPGFSTGFWWLLHLRLDAPGRGMLSERSIDKSLPQWLLCLTEQPTPSATDGTKIHQGITGSDVLRPLHVSGTTNSDPHSFLTSWQIKIRNHSTDQRIKEGLRLQLSIIKGKCSFIITVTLNYNCPLSCCYKFTWTAVSNYREKYKFQPGKIMTKSAWLMWLHPAFSYCV